MLFSFLACVLFCNYLSAENRIVVGSCTKEISSVIDLDPHQKILPCLDDIRRQIYDTLYEVDDEGNLSEALVKSCEVKFYKEDVEVNAEMDIFCKIKDDISFSDGAFLSVEDVIFSIERLKKSSSLSSYFSFISKMSVTPDNEIKFTLNYNLAGKENPKEWLFNQFKYVMARYSYIIHKKYFEGSNTWALEYPVGTGPFYFENWKLWDRRYVRSEIILRKNILYWKSDYPKLDRVIFRFLNPDLWVEHFEAGSLSIIPRLTFNDYNRLLKVQRKKESFKVNRRLSYSYEYLIFNSKSEKLKDESIKDAIGLGINRSVIINHILDGNAYVNTDTTLKASVVYPKKFKEYEFNPSVSRAIIRKYLKIKGIHRDKLQLSLLFTDTMEENLLALQIKKMLYSAGFDLVLYSKDVDTYNALINKGETKAFDIIIYRMEENPNFCSASIGNYLIQGGIQLYQRYIFYAYIRAFSTFIPSTEGGIRLLKTQ